MRKLWGTYIPTKSVIYRRMVMSIRAGSLQRLAWILVGGGLTFAGLLAANWPQWRGPERDGISQETGLLQEWPTEGPKLLWQLSDIGEGYSTPAVVGERAYLISNEGLDNEFVQALDIEDGEQIWAQTIGKVGNPDQRPPYPGSRSTPTIDGEVLYALGSDGDLVCMDTETGSIRWRKHLRNDFGGQFGEWAYSESPLIDGETLVCTPGGEQATLIALNKHNGDVVWKAQVPGGDEAGYASIVIANIDGVKQYVQFMQNGLVGVDAATGKFLWRYDRTAQGSPANIPTPIVRDNLVYSASGRGGGALVEVAQTNGEFSAKEIYYGKKYPNMIGGAVLVGDYLYGTSGPTTVCVEFKTGEVSWTKERGVAPASVCYADGRLYLHGEQTGELALVEATSEEYREHGRFTPPDQPDHERSKAWAYPVVADGRLYVRDMNMLWCYDVKARAGDR
jgi:outer membrane protein assembly factor BamB